MARYSGRNKVSEETRSKAAMLARGIQAPGQTKAQTKLIAQGIERGIDLYKKEQKEKARAQDRAQRERRQQAPKSADAPDATLPAPESGVSSRRAWIPWLLLVLTWAGIAAYGFGQSA